MTNQDWKRLEKAIRQQVTRGVFQGVICLALFAFILAAVWELWNRYGVPWLSNLSH